MRAVADTAILVSALIVPRRTIRNVLRALRDGQFIPIYSTPMMVELIDALGRPTIQAKYHVQPNDIGELINLVRLRGELVIPKRVIQIYRDPKDNKFLEAALAGEADIIITGNDNLLVLHPFEKIDILRPSEFLARL